MYVCVYGRYICVCMCIDLYTHTHKSSIPNRSASGIKWIQPPSLSQLVITAVLVQMTPTNLLASFSLAFLFQHYLKFWRTVLTLSGWQRACRRPASGAVSVHAWDAFEETSEQQTANTSRPLGTSGFLDTAEGLTNNTGKGKNWLPILSGKESAVA